MLGASRGRRRSLPQGEDRYIPSALLQQAGFHRHKLRPRNIAGSGRDTGETTTAEPSTEGSLVPRLDMHRQKSFVVTPRWYDSRFSERPMFLQATDDTSRQVRKEAIRKCSTWLFKYT